MKHPTALVILDGFGYSENKKWNAIHHAHTPFLDYAWQQYPHALLQAAGPAVGLPEGYIGNSQVGHLTLGAGKITKQPVTLINDAIKNNELEKNKTLIDSLEKLNKNNGRLHIMGLLSDAGVHSHIDHLQAYIKIAQQVGIKKIMLHLFLDGRDVSPRSALNFLKQIETDDTVVIGSIHGRFYAMDRDNNWDRIEKSYRCLAKPAHNCEYNITQLIQKSYDENIDDEFIPPIAVEKETNVQDGDGIIFFNFRPDRARQLTAAFINKEFKQFDRQKINLTFFITPTNYDADLETTVLFEQQKIENTLKEKLSAAGKTIFTIAETEKYAHVTYFFTAGHEEAFPNETQVLIPSLKENKYVDHPCMSAPAITEAVLKSLQTNPCDFYLINYANADMVGHSGNFKATQKAIECLDAQLKKLYEELVEKMNGTLYITADHGNAEIMFDEKNNQPHTAHTTSKVPFIMIKKNAQKIELHLNQLSDVAQYIFE